MHPVRILIDVDSTVADLLTPWVEWINTTFNVQVSKDQLEDWDVVRCVPPEVGYKVYDFFKDHVYDKLVPFSGAVDTIRAWHKAGHEIVMVTWASPKYSSSAVSHHADKCGWLREHFDFLPLDSITFCDARHRIPADVYIDDKPSATRAYREAHPNALIWGVKVAPYVEGDQYNLTVAPEEAWSSFASAMASYEKTRQEPPRVCMTPLVDGGLCMTVDCAEHKPIPMHSGAFYPKSVWKMLGKMSSDKTLDTVDAEIAYIRELAQDIRSAAMPPHLKYKLLQDNLKITVDLVEKREKLMVARQFLLPHQTLKVILLRIKQILQRHVTDETLLSKLGKEIGQIDVANSRAAIALLGE